MYGRPPLADARPDLEGAPKSKRLKTGAPADAMTVSPNVKRHREWLSVQACGEPGDASEAREWMDLFSEDSESRDVVNGSNDADSGGEVDAKRLRAEQWRTAPVDVSAVGNHRTVIVRIEPTCCSELDETVYASARILCQQPWGYLVQLLERPAECLARKYWALMSDSVIGPEYRILLDAIHESS